MGAILPEVVNLLVAEYVIIKKQAPLWQNKFAIAVFFVVYENHQQCLLLLDRCTRPVVMTVSGEKKPRERGAA